LEQSSHGRHKRADISHDDKSVRFMQNAGIDIRINKVGSLPLWSSRQKGNLPLEGSPTPTDQFEK